MLGGSCSPCCKSCRDKVRVTFSGLPANCDITQTIFVPGVGYVPDVRYSKLPYVTLDLSTLNGCSFLAFRNTLTTACTFTANIPGPLNSGELVQQLPYKIVFEPENETISIVSDFSTGVSFTTVLTPEPGSSLATFPYDGRLVLSSSGSRNCDASAWTNVRLTIDDGDPTYKPILCPAYTTCAPEVDSLPAAPSGAQRTEIATCSACEPGRHAVAITQVFGTSMIIVPEVPELNVQITIGRMVSNVSPNYYPELGTFPQSVKGFQGFSGTYALKYNLRPRSSGSPFWPGLNVQVQKSDYTVVDLLNPPLQQSYIKDHGPGWSGHFRFIDTSTKYEYLGYQPYFNPGVVGSPYSEPLAIDYMSVGVIPVGAYMPFDPLNDNVLLQPCVDDNIAYVLLLMVRCSVGLNTFTGNLYAPLPCSPRQCRVPPSFSISQTVRMIMPFAIGASPSLGMRVQTVSARALCDVTIQTI